MRRTGGPCERGEDDELLRTAVEESGCSTPRRGTCLGIEERVPDVRAVSLSVRSCEMRRERRPPSARGRRGGRRGEGEERRASRGAMQYSNRELILGARTSVRARALAKEEEGGRARRRADGQVPRPRQTPAPRLARYCRRAAALPVLHKGRCRAGPSCPAVPSPALDLVVLIAPPAAPRLSGPAPAREAAKPTCAALQTHRHRWTCSQAHNPALMSGG